MRKCVGTTRRYLQVASPELSFVETRTAPRTILSPSTTRSCDNKCYVKPLFFGEGNNWGVPRKMNLRKLTWTLVLYSNRLVTLVRMARATIQANPVNEAHRDIDVWGLRMRMQESFLLFRALKNKIPVIWSAKIVLLCNSLNTSNCN